MDPLERSHEHRALEFAKAWRLLTSHIGRAAEQEVVITVIRNHPSGPYSRDPGGYSSPSLPVSKRGNAFECEKVNMS